LQEGLAFTDNGDGTATLAGTPEQDSAGTYELVILAGNALGIATQDFTLTVNAAPAPHGGTHRPQFLDPDLVDAMVLQLPVGAPVWALRRTAYGMALDALD
jgi:hypothetical protein